MTTRSNPMGIPPHCYDPSAGAGHVDRYIGSAFDIVYAVYKQLGNMPTFLEFVNETSPRMEDQYAVIIGKLAEIDQAALTSTEAASTSTNHLNSIEQLYSEIVIIRDESFQYKNNAEDSAAAAKESEDNVANVAEVAAAAGRVYTTVAAGEATRVVGDYFWVVSADDSEVLELWLMGASTASDTGKRTVSANATQEIIDYANEVYGKERLFYIADDDLSVRVTLGLGTLIAETNNSIIVSLVTA